MDQRKNLIAQWAFDARPILGRFHLWLEDVEESWSGTSVPPDGLSFVGGAMERSLVTATAVTALGTRLFGRFGEGKGASKSVTNQIKKDADAASAYALSEGLWYLTRSLPENHAILVSLGEGLMPKGGESPDMGSNPLLGFGRIYARPQVAKFLERRVHRLINEDGYKFEDFLAEIAAARMTVWGAAVDTLENTSRFAKGADTGPLSVLHLFDQPLRIARPYEGYMGVLTLPRAVVEKAAERSILLDVLTPRALVMEAIRDFYPGIRPENVHVWTLAGPTREPRIGKLWEEWRSAGAHLVGDGWALPSGHTAFTDSGTYAPTFLVGPYRDARGETHLFLTDGYAASAEAIQAASLDPILGLKSSMCLLSSVFEAPIARERLVVGLDPDAPDLPEQLRRVLDKDLSAEEADEYRHALRTARNAGMPVGTRTVTVDDFLPRKEWQVLSLSGFMLDDPYSGRPGVETLERGVYRVTTRAATKCGSLEARMTLRLMESFEESRLVFSPLLDRFYRGQDFRTRPVKISDSGRIRNELQTLASEFLEYFGDDGIRVKFDQIPEGVLARDKVELIREVLAWYKANHPIWFRWLEVS
ncbi:hypothetical protein FBQ97_17865 [Acidobacteria bacterium ACD]|nr:MAG: hypothetical protein EDX89_06185 [Acidobacteriota bacterium]MCE7958116.1 hypothetical protein [Acidobacteria bacterium ACB2]MDL1951662.1 hypothetical protein [Acidobacteria bacterium ACD]